MRWLENTMSINVGVAVACCLLVTVDLAQAAGGTIKYKPCGKGTPTTNINHPPKITKGTKVGSYLPITVDVPVTESNPAGKISYCCKNSVPVDKKLCDPPAPKKAAAKTDSALKSLIEFLGQ